MTHLLILILGIGIFFLLFLLFLLSIERALYLLSFVIVSYNFNIGLLSKELFFVQTDLYSIPVIV